MKKDNIKIKGHMGMWYVIDYTYHRGEKIYLVEHQTLGDSSPSLIIDGECNVILDNVYNGFIDLWEIEEE